MMPTWLVRLLHFAGLTNLSDKEVKLYSALRAFEAAQKAVAETARPIIHIASERDVQNEPFDPSAGHGVTVSAPRVCAGGGVAIYLGGAVYAAVTQVVAGHPDATQSAAWPEHHTANVTHQ